MITLVSDEKRLFKSSVILTLFFILILWLVWFFDALFDLHLSKLGVHPGNLLGLRGILFMPFIHDTNGVGHILSNSISLLVLVTILLNTYPKVAFKTILIVQLLSGSMVWLFAASNQYHIGASAVVFGIAAFLFASGILRRDRVSVAVSFFVGLFYSSSILNGLFPTEPNISWQGHLSGVLAGLFCAFIFRKIDLPIDKTFEDEEQAEFIDEDDRPFFEQLEQREDEGKVSLQSTERRDIGTYN